MDFHIKKFLKILSILKGEMSERLKEHAWKACIWKRIKGSNPFLTKKNIKKYIIINKNFNFKNYIFFYIIKSVFLFFKEAR
jgi:hypothetical protein